MIYNVIEMNIDGRKSKLTFYLYFKKQLLDQEMKIWAECIKQKLSCY